jgi:hypothetical protein
MVTQWGEWCKQSGVYLVMTCVCVCLQVVFVFDYKLCLCLLTNSGKDQLDRSFIGLEISEIVRDRRLVHSCSV